MYFTIKLQNLIFMNHSTQSNSYDEPKSRKKLL